MSRVTTRGQGDIRLDPQSGGGPAFAVHLEYVVEPGLAPQVTAYSIRSDPGGTPIPVEARRGIEDNLEVLVDRLHASLIANEEREEIVVAGTVRVAGEAGAPVEAPIKGAKIRRRYTDPEAVEESVYEDLRQTRRRRHITPDLLAEVAEVYRGHPEAPTKAVRDAMSVSAAQASRYVAQARAAGILAPRGA